MARIAILWIVSLGALLATGSPAAQAARPPFPVALNVTAAAGSGGNQLTATVRSLPGAGCVLEVKGRGISMRPAPKRAGRTGVVVWSWPAAGVASDAPWRFTVTCTSGRSWSQRWLEVEPGFPSAAALDPAGALAPSTPGAACDEQGLCFAADPFPAGQCTWYAAGRRPDLLGVLAGNAGSWLAAARGRVPEGWFPVVGALAVWLPHHAGAGADGHVAYVAAVSPDGNILVDDSNWAPTPSSPRLEVHEHWVPAIAPSGFIYGGPARSGP